MPPKTREIPIPVPYRDATLTLRDGRQLAYVEHGDPKGKPIFWFHGTPGARLQVPPDAPDAAQKLGLRIIGVDRPGTGGSSDKPGRTLLSWARDVEEAADALGIERFAAVGLSGGGPYVLACAHELAERMVAGISLGGLAPTAGRERAATPASLLPLWGAARAMDVVRAPLGMALSAAVRPLRPWLSPMFDFYARYGARVDRQVLERPDIRAALTADLDLAMRGGMRGMVRDVALFSQPWRFSPRDIQIPIRFWHGDADPVVPLSHSRHLATLVPNSRLFVLSGQGHFAGFCNSRRVFADLLTLWP